MTDYGEINQLIRRYGKKKSFMTVITSAISNKMRALLMKQQADSSFE